MAVVRSELAEHALIAVKSARLAVSALEEIGESGDPRSQAIALDALRLIRALRSRLSDG